MGIKFVFNDFAFLLRESIVVYVPDLKKPMKEIHWLNGLKWLKCVIYGKYSTQSSAPLFLASKNRVKFVVVNYAPNYSVSLSARALMLIPNIFKGTGGKSEWIFCSSLMKSLLHNPSNFRLYAVFVNNVALWGGHCQRLDLLSTCRADLVSHFVLDPLLHFPFQ